MQTLPLLPALLPRAAALSALIGWNQVAADWRVFAEQGAVRVLEDGDPQALAASAAVLPYGPDVAWIAMVLVRPELRRRGLASGLMSWAIEELRARGTASLALDASPAGRLVYEKLGFRPLWGFTRWALPAALPAEPSVNVRPLRAEDWPALLALDAAAFGAPRAALLRSFAARAPAGALVVDGAQGLAGALLARDGLHGPQLGPLWAKDAATARALAAAGAAALPAAVLDVPDDGFGLPAWLAAHGAVHQRPFTRMVRGPAPAANRHLFAAVAGPEFG